VRSAYLHAGPARSLVHHLKYRGVVAAARLLAEGMVELIPEGVVLVPVPRVTWRRLRYGVDPARELVTQLGQLSGRPVRSLLSPPVWGRARAGGVHGFAPRFHLRAPVPPLPALLVDDVVTTGTTLAVAASLLPEVAGAITATASVGGRLIDRSPRP
jgi:predicted amidophosphoribosyltransferase